MTQTDQEREDETLRRMLKTPPKPHKARVGDVERFLKSGGSGTIEVCQQGGEIDITIAPSAPEDAT